jgi:hypothetical protein
MEYLFVDLENIAPETLSGLPSGQTVFIFSGEKQTKIKTGLVVSLIDRGPYGKLIPIHGDGKNALDLHIAFYLGKLSESDRSASFKILSKDKGFDALVNHLKKMKLDCARIEKLPEKNPPRVDSKAKLSAFSAHLRGLSEKGRPKKASKLKAYLKNWAKDEMLAESIFKGLLAEKQIEMEGEKIKYLGNP